MLAYLNSSEALRQSYQGYLANLREEVVFNHTQAQKLDSLTSYYYFNEKTVIPTIAANQKTTGNVNLYVDSSVKLFLDDIYKQQKHLQQGDYRLQLATAPVTLENHFTTDPRPVNGRIKCLLLFFLLGWAVGCIIAALIDKRKAICAWLQR